MTDVVARSNKKSHTSNCYKYDTKNPRKAQTQQKNLLKWHTAISAALAAGLILHELTQDSHIFINKKFQDFSRRPRNPMSRTQTNHGDQPADFC